jgi:hypothetical protein
MKTKKLLRKVKAFLSADRRAQMAKADSLEEILKKLERKAASLRKKLDAEKDQKERIELLRKLEVVDAQRVKGEKLGRELEAKREAS